MCDAHWRKCGSLLWYVRSYLCLI
uniref:Uncharacterized protein n=1 Tax=Anguilla anguilla TaxID=7936 RepID=A0A0E9UAR5_ANGAN